ncbi:MFS transporter [Bacteroides sp. 224]|uniref:MFS transporter n=1 Tax=Bacteroides sp. 224 TaxID=2302936 RepID=UPI0013D2DDF0|nr:MFS transporter [Bacteroides sp. 224]NDV64845.1 MFS transporter [Bacteroides sp. 224]
METPENEINSNPNNSQLSTLNSQLLTPGYCFILAANFLLFFAFYLILPILPFYLTEVFETGHALVGVILSSYTVAALCIRPFSGYLLDTFSRKPLYLIAYFIFTSIFAGYMLAGVLTLFIMFRVVHGLAFGMVTVAGNTIVIDITPSSRRGEAIGYYGLMNNMAMSFGPMVGLFMHDIYSFQTIFLCSLISGTLGFVMACLVKTPEKVPVPREPISLDRFILLKGIPAGVSLLLLSVPYGMTSTYVAMYAKEIGISISSGLFFTCMAVGMAVSRMFSGRQVDKGRITQVIKLGLYLVCICYFLLAACGSLMAVNEQITTVLFFLIALLLGIGFGTMFPAFNSLFVNLAPNSKRGTATSTYLTSWDVGIGIGLTAGGYLAQYTSFDMTYFFGACLTVVSAIFFNLKVAPHFHKNKLR